MKNVTTPRTLAQCQFVTGYQSANPKPSRAADWSLATVIGICIAVALVHWWAS